MSIERVLFASVLALLLAPVAVGGDAGQAPRRAARTSPDPPLVAEYRYRIVGQVRLLLFWAGRDDVGGARMASYSDGDTSVLALLVGSDPSRAPRRLNEWGYLREEVQPGRADVFAVRRMDEAPAAPPVGDSDPVDGPLFGAVCTSIEGAAVRSVRTAVTVERGVTYAMFGRILDGVAAAPEWKTRRTTGPAGTVPGFLTALQRLMRVSVATPKPPPSASRLVYFYNDALYDLDLRRVQALGPTTVGTRTFERLVRSDFSITNRATRHVTKLVVTFEPDTTDAPVPVRIQFQPNWWLRVELRLDDSAEVPADPAADRDMLARIRRICADASR